MDRRDVQIGAGVRLQGPLVIGDGAVIGEGAALHDSVVLPGHRDRRPTRS